ncbi:alpha/beta fold hydrolase [Streptomyces anulatus]
MIDVLERAERNGPTVLVAHSRGGITTTAVANARPDLVDRIVYVSAWCPRRSGGGRLLRRAGDGRRRRGSPHDRPRREPGRTRAAALQLPHGRPDDARRPQQCLRRDLTDDEFRTILSTFQPDGNLDAGTSADRARATTWGRMPRTYVRPAADAGVPPTVQDRMIREADALTPDNPFDVRTLEGSHLRRPVHPEARRRVLAGLAGF